MEIKNILPKPSRTYTPEEIEASRRAVAARYNNFTVCRSDCEICGGIGYLSAGDGSVRICPNLFQSTILRNPQRYGLSESELSLDWAHIKPFGNAPKISRQIQDWFEHGSGWLYLWGEHGLAKTLSLKICVALALKSGREAAYTNMAGILDHLRAAFDQANPSETSQIRLDWWSKLPLLAIDEIDRVNSTPWAVERRFLLLDTRYTQGIRGETKTIIASNVGPDELDSGTDRYIADRIGDARFTVIQVSGSSARRVVPKNVRF